MKYLNLSQSNDEQRLLEKIEEFVSLSNEELIAKYNREVRIGIVGVRAQMIHIWALHHTFLKRFNKSPMGTEDNSSISLGSKIFYDPSLENFWTYCENWYAIHF